MSRVNSADIIFLGIPPFPRRRGDIPWAVEQSGRLTSAEATGALAERLRTARVGGRYWATQPALPPSPFLILRPADAAQAEKMLVAAQAQGTRALLWLAEETVQPADTVGISVVKGDCDPWHMLERAEALWCGGEDENALIAALLGKEVRFFDTGGRFGELDGSENALHRCIERELTGRFRWRDPFTGEDAPVGTIIGMCASWRRLIDANRPIRAAFGFGQWKQDTVDALLWNGEGEHSSFLPPQSENLAALPADAGIAVWKARVPGEFLAICEARPAPLFEVEDGFIRSVGLGADCVPPLSIAVDPLGAHYDPSRPSTLENLLASHEFDASLLARAAQLREVIVASGLSKYGLGGPALARPGGTKRHVLVPGQVEDDRSVLAGGGSVRGNLDLLARSRAAEPDAYILYKPHPDVLAGHRKGHVAEADALRYADAIVCDQAISALLDMVDGVHVMTSLAGFEALLRGKDVTTHGVPFYAGWGLTRDLGDVPARRGVKRSLDELVAATLLLYPRYLDPLTGLPCPAELLVERIRSGARRENRAVVMLRRTQGNLRRMISRLGFAA